MYHFSFTLPNLLNTNYLFERKTFFKFCFTLKSIVKVFALRVKFTSRWYPVLLKCFKVVCNLNTLSVYMKTACLLVDTNAFFSG